MTYYNLSYVIIEIINCIDSKMALNILNNIDKLEMYYVMYKMKVN